MRVLFLSLLLTVLFPLAPLYALEKTGDFPTLPSAIAEIKRLNAQIERIEGGYAQKLTEIQRQVGQRYAAQLAALEREKKRKPESDSDFKIRQAHQRTELNHQREAELSRLNTKTLAEGETAPLRVQIAKLEQRGYLIGTDSIAMQLGQYDTEQQSFPVNLINRNGKLVSSGVIPLSPTEMLVFRKQYSAGSVRPEVRMRPNGEVLEVAVVNEADQSRRLELEGKFIVISAKEREARLREIALEREMLIYRPQMLPIPAGVFFMGSNINSEEKPIHKVNVSAFQMAKTEVTQAQWQAIMGSNPSNFNKCADCPVENVSWGDTQAYLQKLNEKTGQLYRLPSESEWEYACRAGGTHEYCGGDNLDIVAWTSGNSARKTRPVGQLQANDFGLYDMSGNVWEWVQDCWNENYLGASLEGKSMDTGDCGRRMRRGGSWINGPQVARSAFRFRSYASERGNYLGFRIVLDSSTGTDQ